MLCRRLEPSSEASVAIDGSKFKAVNPPMTVTGISLPEGRTIYRFVT
jgi:hypothetical protein